MVWLVAGRQAADFTAWISLPKAVFARAVFVEDEVAAFSDRPAGGAPAPVRSSVFGLSSSCR
jgi:hypothetical protein